MARCSVSRRTVLGGCVLTSGYLRSAHADEPVDPARLQLPQPGDRLVEACNDSGSAPLKPVDIDSQNPLLAWAFDPRKKLVRDGSRLNMVLLMRFDAAALSAAEKATAPDGVVAYSAVCTQAHPLTDRRRGSDGSRAGEAWEVTFKDGRPQQNNFDGFVVARIDDAPLNVTGRNLFMFIARARQSSTRRLKPSSRGQDVPTGLIEDFVKCRSLQGFFDHRDQSGVAEGFSQPKSFRL